MRSWPFAVAVVIALAACTDGGTGAEPSLPAASPTADSTADPAETNPQAATEAPGQPDESETEPVAATVHLPPEFDGAAAFATVEYLAGEIGPREATSAAYHEAAGWVADQFEALGYDVTVVDVPVPRGDPSYRPEWGTVVEPGTSSNILGDSAGLDPTEPHVVIGGHLDTVAVAPGAEDNASGIAVMLELAALAAEHPPELPVRFIAFGAEEPRGSGDAMHHFGSQQYVGDLSNAARASVVAMVALDRVGAPASSVPICTGGTGTTEVMDALADAARAADVTAHTCENRLSDHWSFEKAGMPSARLGSVPYEGYHSTGDVPDVVDPAQLERSGTIVWHWLRALSTDS